jgi:predicted nucleotidyltransferase
MTSSNNSSSRLDENDEFKSEKIYESREGRLRAIAHIIKEYLQVKEIDSNPKTVDNAMAPIINMVLNDKEFRKFVVENYKALILYDEKDAEFYIKKITDEMLELIKEEENIDNLENKDFENKITELESSLNKR